MVSILLSAAVTFLLQAVFGIIAIGLRTEVSE